MQYIQANWKTTALGGLIILKAVIVLLTAMIDDETAVNADQFLTEILAGWALIFARDGNVTSEDSVA